MAKSGIAAGLNKGHVVTPRDKKLKPSHSKGVRQADFTMLCCVFLLLLVLNASYSWLGNMNADNDGVSAEDWQED